MARLIYVNIKKKVNQNWPEHIAAKLIQVIVLSLNENNFQCSFRWYGVEKWDHWHEQLNKTRIF